MLVMSAAAAEGLGAERVMTEASLAASLDRIFQVQPHMSGPYSLTMAIVGIVVAITPGVWHIARPVHVIAHEAAHATIGAAVGLKIIKMEFKFNGEGKTRLAGDDSSLIQFPAAFVGYLGPGAFGVGAAELIRIGHSVAVLWVAVAGLIPIMYLARKSVGVIIVIATFVVLLLLAGSASVGVQVTTAYVIAWFLLVSGARVITVHGRRAGDAGVLREMTGLPNVIWPVLWFIGAAAGLLFGAGLLL
jgi:Peptidase M50B-like